MDNILALLFIAAIVGVFKPYIGNFERRHFAIAAGLIFIAFAAIVPPSQKANPEEKSVAKVAPQPQKIDKLKIVRAFRASIFDGMEPCDAAGKELARVGEGLTNGRTTIYDGYGAAQKADEACRQSWSTIRELKVPDALSEAGRKKADEALQLCSSAALARQIAASQMSDVFDGDMRPSMIKQSQEKAQAAQNSLVVCVGAIFDLASTEGVDFSKLQ